MRYLICMELGCLLVGITHIFFYPSLPPRQTKLRGYIVMSLSRQTSTSFIQLTLNIVNILTWICKPYLMTALSNFGHITPNDCVLNSYTDSKVCGLFMIYWCAPFIWTSSFNKKLKDVYVFEFFCTYDT